MFGFFGNIFDFNRDGKLDSFERAAEFATFASIMDEEKNRVNNDHNDWDDIFDEDEDDIF